MHAMKRIVLLACALGGICFSPQVATLAQDGNVPIIDSKAADNLWLMRDLQQKLEEAERDLDSIKSQTNLTTTPKDRVALATQLQRLDMEIQRLRKKITALKAAVANEPQRFGINTITAGPSNCCKMKRAEERDGHPIGASYSCLANQEEMLTSDMILATALDQSCPRATHVISSRKPKQIEVSLSGDHNGFAHGNNTFCILFRSSGSENLIDPGEVNVEATISTKRLNFARAVVRVTRLSAGHFCARTNFPVSGSWLITVTHNGAQANEKVVFEELVN